MFKFYDTEQTGYITQDHFQTILDSMTRQYIPGHVKERLGTIGELNMRKGHVTYAQFMAVQAILLHMPSYVRILRTATNNDMKAHISKEKFLQVAYSRSTVEVTPMELDILYHVFSTDNASINLQGVLSALEKLPKLPASRHREVEGSGFQRLVAQAKESAVNFALGSVAGGIGATAVYPIDLVKTRMQNQRAVRLEERLYKNSIDCFQKVVSREGFLGLYKGLVPQLVGVAPEKAIKLTVNDLLRGLFEDKKRGDIYFPLEVLAGAGAGASQVVFTNPLEIVKIRLQVAGEVGARPSAMQICRQLGIVGLYKGASACFLRDIPFSAIYFPTYAKMKIVLADDNGKLGKLDLLLAGAIAGVPAASLVTPADVIKTRLQVEARKGEATYSGIADCAAKIYATEGPSAFFKVLPPLLSVLSESLPFSSPLYFFASLLTRTSSSSPPLSLQGAGARVFRSSPQFGITLLSYEMLQSYLAPDLPARPPTNAPVTQKDIDNMRDGIGILRVADLENRWRLSR
jgi:solute carrier family 25 aspartate/glutamate transporter 12/13